MGRGMMIPGGRRPLPRNPEEVAQVPITDQDRMIWAGLETMPDAPEDEELNTYVTVSMSVTQWAVVTSSLRVGMALSKEPGMIRLAHDHIYQNVITQMGDAHHRQHTDGDPEGETQ